MAKILVLGAGMVGSAMARDLGARHQVLCADRDPSALAALAGAEGVSTQELDCQDSAALLAAAGEQDLVVCAVPGFLGFATLQSLLQAGKPIADISFFPEEALDLHQQAVAAEVAVVTDIGVAPGLDNLILGWHDAQMKVSRFECLVGGLPEARTWPWLYKAPFSPMDVVEEYLRPARLMEQGKVVVKEALSDPSFVEFDGVGTLEAFNTDGLRSLLQTMAHIPDMAERTLRYPGHREMALALRESGFLDDTPVGEGEHAFIPREVTSKMLFREWKLEPGEAELTVMRVTVEGEEEGQQVRHIWDLDDRTDPATGTSSMARTTGYTCTGMVEAMLAGKWTRPGISPGEIVGREQGLFSFVREHLAARGVTLQHRVESL
jgi:lysine 6-dehydrogenase